MDMSFLPDFMVTKTQTIVNASGMPLCQVPFLDPALPHTTLEVQQWQAVVTASCPGATSPPIVSPQVTASLNTIGIAVLGGAALGLIMLMKG